MSRPQDIKVFFPIYFIHFCSPCIFYLSKKAMKNAGHSQSELRPAKIRENTHEHSDIAILCPYLMCVQFVNKHDKKAHRKMGTAFLLPLLLKTNVPQHEHNMCAPSYTNKFYTQYSISYYHCQLLFHRKQKINMSKYEIKHRSNDMTRNIKLLWVML